ncbi:transposase [Pasteuria penetrans]|uniref:transposase n=1 Tax=Pasteuria penetrans TaxID=86005 RepID=UPI000F9A2E08|nr:transposase [Pasteuria penetrans]
MMSRTTLLNTAPNITSKPWLSLPQICNREKSRLTTLQRWCSFFSDNGIRVRKKESEEPEFALMVRFVFVMLLWGITGKRELCVFLQGNQWAREILGVGGDFSFVIMQSDFEDYDLHVAKSMESQPTIVVNTIHLGSNHHEIPENLCFHSTHIDTRLKCHKRGKTRGDENYHVQCKLHLLTDLSGSVTLGLAVTPIDVHHATGIGALLRIVHPSLDLVGTSIRVDLRRGKKQLQDHMDKIDPHHQIEFEFEEYDDTKIIPMRQLLHTLLEMNRHRPDPYLRLFR